jgi:hypothetical protein
LQVSNIVIKKRHYTIAALKDELTRTLSSAAEYNVNEQSKHIEIDYKYYRYARQLLYLTSLAKEIPVFEIRQSDIPMELKNELERLDEETLDEVIVDSICRLYESVNFKHFHESGVRGKIKWRILPN